MSGLGVIFLSFTGIVFYVFFFFFSLVLYHALRTRIPVDNPFPLPHRTFTHIPLRIGDHVFVGERTVVSAASVGSYVHIGHDAVVGDLVVIKDYVRVLDGAVIAPNTVVPSFSIVAGRPARVIGEVPEGGHEAFQLRELYKTVGNNPQPAAVV